MLNFIKKIYSIIKPVPTVPASTLISRNATWCFDKGNYSYYWISSSAGGYEVKIHKSQKI